MIVNPDPHISENVRQWLLVLNVCNSCQSDYYQQFQDPVDKTLVLKKDSMGINSDRSEIFEEKYLVIDYTELMSRQ